MMSAQQSMRARSSMQPDHIRSAFSVAQSDQSSIGALWIANNPSLLQGTAKLSSECVHAKYEVNLCRVHASEGTTSHFAAQISCSLCAAVICKDKQIRKAILHERCLPAGGYLAD